MLNPSKADDQLDDKTINRLIFFTKKFGYGGFYVGNLYPKITPYVNELYVDLSHNNIPSDNFADTISRLENLSNNYYSTPFTTALQFLGNNNVSSDVLNNLNTLENLHWVSLENNVLEEGELEEGECLSDYEEERPFPYNYDSH